MRYQVKQDWKTLTKPDEVAEIVRAILKSESEIDRDKEHLWVLGLNAVNKIAYIDLVSLGCLDSTIVMPREVFRLAIMKAVKSIIVAHNHPSGNKIPSNDDEEVFTRLRRAGEIIGIKVLDLVIVTDTDFTSMA